MRLILPLTCLRVVPRVSSTGVACIQWIDIVGSRSLTGMSQAFRSVFPSLRDQFLRISRLTSQLMVVCRRFGGQYVDLFYWPTQFVPSNWRPIPLRHLSCARSYLSMAWVAAQAHRAFLCTTQKYMWSIPSAIDMPHTSFQIPYASAYQTCRSTGCISSQHESRLLVCDAHLLLRSLLIRQL